MPSAIANLLDRHPSAGLVITPVPIVELPRLSALLGCQVYALRDDLTGFGIGGNKVRKLDYLIGDANRCGADTLVTMKASSFSRNAAAACAAFNLELHVVLPGSANDHNVASRHLFDALDTRLHYTYDQEANSVERAYDTLTHELKSAGNTVYELHPGGSDAIGALGYVQAFREITDYSAETGAHFDHILHATGSTGTQVGLMLGQHLSGYSTTITGIAVSQPAGVQSGRVRDLAAEVSQQFELDWVPDNLVVDDQYLGEGYAIPSAEAQSASELFARAEGLLLDDVYTAKAAAALVGYAQDGRIGAAQNVLFIHTGGNAGVFY